MLPKQKLIDLDQPSLFRGNVLRLPAKHPYEERVDFMLFETGFDERRYGLMVSSGYKAGIPLVYLPLKAKARIVVSAVIGLSPTGKPGYIPTVTFRRSSS